MIDLHKDILHSVTLYVLAYITTTLLGEGHREKEGLLHPSSYISFLRRTVYVRMSASPAVPSGEHLANIFGVGVD